MIGSAGRVGIEPSLRRDIADELRDLSVDVAPLVEGLRLVKSPDEVAMIRRTAALRRPGRRRTARGGVPRRDGRRGFRPDRGLEQGDHVRGRRLGDPDDNASCWRPGPPRRSAQPHSIPDLGTTGSARAPMSPCPSCESTGMPPRASGPSSRQPLPWKPGEPSGRWKTRERSPSG